MPACRYLLKESQNGLKKIPLDNSLIEKCIIKISTHCIKVRASKVVGGQKSFNLRLSVLDIIL